MRAWRARFVVPLGFVVGFVVACVGGCAPSLRGVAARDLRCPEAELEVEGVSETTPHTVRGCGKIATYVYEEQCNVTYLGKSCGGKRWTRRGAVIGD